MRKNISVFNHDRNPATDSPNFFITRHEADERVNSGFAHYLSDKSIQHRPPVTWTRDRSTQLISSLFDEAWAPQWSGNFIVWQMRSTE